MSNTCRHTYRETTDSFCCCLSCGELITEATPLATPERPFKYEPLDCETEQHIRLVHIYPGQKRDDIVCELVHVNLAVAPIYEAVSYTWATADGDASLSQFVVCRGRKLAITKNCEAALRCLRRQECLRVLWIDALCIDQNSTKERNHQVRLMDVVYSNASQVLLYLGFRHPESMSRFLGYLDERSRGIFIGDRSISRSAILEFLQHPYFNRVWVLQEISLAKLVVLYTDYERIHWDAHTVRELVILCQILKHNIPGVLNWLPAIRRDEHNCLDLLHRARRCMATDPRDKVFALYGFLPLHFRKALPINYASGTEKVYWNIAAHLISTTRRLDVLKHVMFDQPLDLDVMPSWAPDWDRCHSTDVEIPEFTIAQMESFAAFSSRALVEHSPNDDIQRTTTQPTHDESMTQLSSRNYPILCYRYQNTDDHRPPLQRVYAMGSSAIPCLRTRGYLLDKVATHTYRNPKPYLPYSQPISTPFLRAKVCHSCGEYVRWKRHEGSLYSVKPKLRGEGQAFEAYWEAFETQQSIGYTVLPREELLSRNQRVRSVELGDTIWALEGLDVPVILRRKTQDGEDFYILVGQCCLDGAGLDQECPTCRSGFHPWSMEYATIEIW